MGDDELGLAERWIIDTLLADTAVTDWVGDRVFDSPPPRGTTYPYIVINMTSTDDVRGTGVARIFSDSIYTVKAVAETKSAEVLSPLVAAVDVALTLPQPVPVGTDGTALACVRERSVLFRELSEGNYYSHRGGDYRIQTQVN